MFIEPGCKVCNRAVELAKEVDAAYPALSVRIVDVKNAPAERDNVFAVPTFLLNDDVLSLGNPQRGQLRERIEALLYG